MPFTCVSAVAGVCLRVCAPFSLCVFLCCCAGFPTCTLIIRVAGGGGGALFPAARKSSFSSQSCHKPLVFESKLQQIMSVCFVFLTKLSSRWLACGRSRVTQTSAGRFDFTITAHIHRLERSFHNNSKLVAASGGRSPHTLTFTPAGNVESPVNSYACPGTCMQTPHGSNPELSCPEAEQYKVNM